MVKQVEVKENLLELINFQLINPKYKLETVNISTSVDNIILLSKVVMEIISKFSNIMEIQRLIYRKDHSQHLTYGWLLLLLL